jgi:hypothetical protein
VLQQPVDPVGPARLAFARHEFQQVLLMPIVKACVRADRRLGLRLELVFIPAGLAEQIQSFLFFVR